MGKRKSFDEIFIHTCVFAIGMVCIRFLILLLLKVNTSQSIFSLFNERYYFGNGSYRISGIRYMYEILNNLWDSLFGFVNGIEPYGLQMAIIFILIIPGLIMLCMVILTGVLLGLGIRFIALVDSFIPNNISVMIGYLLISLIIGLVINIIWKEDEDNYLKPLIIKPFVVILISAVAIIFFKDARTNIEKNKVDINRLMIAGGTAYVNSIYSDVEIVTFDDFLNYAQSKTSVFKNILDNNGIESRISGNGVACDNVNKEYSIYDTTRTFDVLYKLVPNWEKGICEEVFYVRLSIPTVFTLTNDDKIFYLIKDLTREIAGVEITSDEVMQMYNKAKKYKLQQKRKISDNNLMIKVRNDNIYIEHKNISKIAIYEKNNNEYNNDGYIINNIRTYETISDFRNKNNIRERREALIEKYSTDNMVIISKSDYNYGEYIPIQYNLSIVTDSSSIKDKKIQFADRISLEVPEENDVQAFKTAFEILKEFTNYDLGTADEYLNYLTTLNAVSTSNYNGKSNVFELDEYIYPPFLQFKIDVLENGLSTKIPVIAEGIGYMR